MSVVAYGEDDQMMRTRGKWSVSKTSLDWIEGGALSDSVDVPAFLGGYLDDCLAYVLADSETVYRMVSSCRYGPKEITNLERKCFIFFKLDKENGLLIVHGHEFALSIPWISSIREGQV